MKSARRLAYADPPYPGTAKKRYGGIEVNHRLLIAHLREFDGWALSTSASALREIWNLCPEARCASWTKTFVSNGWSRVRYSWEAVLFVTDRKGIKPGERSTVWDSLVCSPKSRSKWRTATGMTGGDKPPEFVEWLRGLLGADDGDELTDLFPGSGAVSQAWSVRQLPIAP